MRDSFIFYRSFYDSIKELSESNRAKCYDAIFEYALNHNDVELKGVPRAILTLIRPNLEANYRKYLNGTKQKGSKTEAKGKQAVSKPQGNVDVNVDVNVNDNVDVDVDEIYSAFSSNIHLITPNVADSIKSYLPDTPPEWILKAIDEAGKHNKRSWSYCEAVLRTWKEKGHVDIRDKSADDNAEQNKRVLAKIALKQKEKANV